MAGNKKRVLIVDDDVDFLDSSEATLTAAGFEVTTAKSGEEGLVLAKGMRPDVIILDLMLEHPDTGFAVAHQLRRSPEGAEVPILMVTSVARETGLRFDLASDENRRWIKVDRILNKPVPGAELVAKVSELLAESAG